MHKIILLFLGLSMSSTVFAQSWQKAYDAVWPTSNGQYLAKRGNKQGLLSATGKIIIPLEQDSLLEKPTAFLGLTFINMGRQPQAVIQTVFDKKGKALALKANESWPEPNDPIWNGPKIPKGKLIIRIYDQKKKSYLFKRDSFDFFRFFAGTERRFALAQKEDKTFIVNCKTENYQELRNHHFLASPYSDPQLFYQGDSLCFYSSENGNLLWSSTKKLSKIQLLTLDSYLIQFENGRKAIVDKSKDKVWLLPKSFNKKTVEHRLNRDFLISKAGENKIYVSDIYGKNLKSLSGQSYKLFAYRTNEAEREPFFVYQNEGQDYFFNCLNNRKIKLPEGIPANSSSRWIHLLDIGHKEQQFLLGIGSPQHNYYVEVDFNNRKTPSQLIIKQSFANEEFFTIKRPEQNNLYFFIDRRPNPQNIQTVFRYENGQLSKELEGKYIVVPQKNKAFWGVYSIYEYPNFYFYDVLKAKPLLDIDLRGGFILDHEKNIQFATEHYDRPGLMVLHNKKGILIDSFVHIDDSIKTKERPYQPKPDLIMLYTGKLLGPNKLFKAEHSFLPQMIVDYREGNKFASLAIGEYTELYSFSGQQIPIAPIYRYKMQLSAWALLKNQEKNYLLLDMAKGRSNDQIKVMEQEEFFLASKKHNQNYGPNDKLPARKELDYLVHCYPKDGKLIHTLYRLSDLSFYKSFALPLQYPKNSQAQFDYKKEVFVGPAHSPSFFTGSIVPLYHYKYSFLE